MTKTNPKQILIKELIKKRVKTQEALDRVKRAVSKKFKISTLSNVDLLKVYHKLLDHKKIKKSKSIEALLKKRPIRSLSGIVNVSVLTKPYPCPGKCIYCPSEKGIPKSYLAEEPAVMRAILNKFDPYLQTKNRVQALKTTGHPTDKIELRIIGGTWSFYPKQYQTWFIKKCFQAANEGPKSCTAVDRVGPKGEGLEESQKKNEKAENRIVGISIETRPDFIDEKEIKRLRKLGITGVELGVQSIYDDVLKLNQRGHTIKETILATKLLKDAGFKICYQLMPNLPGSDWKKDKKMFQEIFSNPDFQPDLLKIYPLALLKEAPLYKWWKQGKFKPYAKKELIELLIEIKKQAPRFCRIQRVIRDFPSQKVVAGGARVSNLRQVVQAEMKKRNLKCHCIRCREIREDYDPKEKLILFRQGYQASEGQEIFLSYENKNQEKLYSLLRLRIQSENSSRTIFPALKDAAIIREVHTYGQMVPITKRTIAAQHRGLGKKLIKKAEEIAKKEFGLKKMAVISAIGTRNYFRGLEYRLEDTYMIKRIG